MGAPEAAGARGKIKLDTGKIPEEFWKLPRPEDPEGLAVRYLIEDRRQAR
jgi:hypothetical protein